MEEDLALAEDTNSKLVKEKKVRSPCDDTTGYDINCHDGLLSLEVREEKKPSVFCSTSGHASERKILF